MTKAEPAVILSLDETLVIQIDRLVSEGLFRNRNQAIEEAVREKLERMSQNRLAAECAKLDLPVEQSLAEEGMAEELHHWPDY